jgi:hypothetical protein
LMVDDGYSGLHLGAIQNLTPSIPDTPLLAKERGRGAAFSVRGWRSLRRLAW